MEVEGKKGHGGDKGGLELETRRGIWDSGLKKVGMDKGEEIVHERDGKQDSSKDTCEGI